MRSGRKVHTLRDGLRAVLLSLLLVVLTGAVLVGGELRRLDNDVDTLVDSISPARLTAESLSAAYLDQETGVRGFLLSRDPASLTPYTEGVRDAEADTAELRRLVGDIPTIRATIDDLSQAGLIWRTEYADLAISAARAADDKAAVRISEKRGQRLFDTIRTRFDELNETLSLARSQARESANDEMDRLRVIAGGALVTAILAGFAVWLSLRRLVLRPLERLGSATRVVARGEFGTEVVADGPAEIRRLGNDVEDMRNQLAIALAHARQVELEVREQAQRLGEQADELELQAQDLRRSNEELEQFAYVASHDLQEPLRKVASFCQMLQRRYGGELDERADQYIEFAVDGSKRMQQLINDLLAFSRVGRTTEAWEEVDTAVIARHALDTLSDTTEEAGASVEFGELPVVHGDDALLTQVFQNLIGNGIKFRAPDRPPVIRVSAQREDEFWHFVCEDNGIGIDPQYAGRIFVIFQRLHSKDQYTGTGIGLSLCKKIVEYHGGRIWLDTDRDGRPGTAVHWTLPVEPAAITSGPTTAALEGANRA